jgi:AraC family transcriptional activator of pobA
MKPTLLQKNYSNVFQSTETSTKGLLPGRKGHFEIHTLEWLHQNLLLQEIQEERLRFYEITWFVSANGTLNIDSITHTIKNNSVYCFVPGQVRNYKVNGKVKGYQISFSPDFLYMGANYTRMAPWLESYTTDINVPVIEADPEMEMEMNEIIRQMQKEFSNYYLLRSEILSGLLNILMIHFSRKLQVSINDYSLSKDAELVRKFKILLKEHFTTKKQVADYATELCVTPNYLNRTVKKITGFTASHHIQQHLILEAKRQAIHSNGSMKEVAYFLGFDNLAHFSKFFKNNCGMNFTNFKKGLAYVG